MEPLDAPRAIDAAQLRGDDETDDRRQRRVAGLAAPGLVIGEGGRDVRQDDPQDVGQTLNPMDDVFVLAKQVSPEPPDIKRSAFLTLANCRPASHVARCRPTGRAPPRRWVVYLRVSFVEIDLLRSRNGRCQFEVAQN